MSNSFMNQLQAFTIISKNTISQWKQMTLFITNVFPLPGLVSRNRSYTTLQDESLKVFSSLQHLEGVADSVPIIQGILQTGQELKPLRDELYCQLIKQTTRPPQPGSPGNLCSWKILACMSCTFVPTRSILRYLKFHMKRYLLTDEWKEFLVKQGGFFQIC